jgi:hypothetical protein
VAFLNTFLAIEKSIFRLKRQENSKKEERGKGKRRREKREDGRSNSIPLCLSASPLKRESVMW